MYEIFITTVASRHYSPTEIKKIVSDLSVRNLQKGLTGVLIYFEGEFYQILEGEKETLIGLMDVITNDPRHGNAHIIWEGEIKERGYKNWGLSPSLMNDMGLDTIYAEKAANISTSQRLLETLAKTSGFNYSALASR